MGLPQRITAYIHRILTWYTLNRRGRDNGKTSIEMHIITDGKPSQTVAFRSVGVVPGTTERKKPRIPVCPKIHKQSDVI